MAEKVSNKIIGIDLGTTNSVVSIIENGEVKVLINAHGSKLTASIVGFSDKGERLVGELAKRGLTLARRTVAKYRSVLNIPPARRRRQFE